MDVSSGPARVDPLNRLDGLATIEEFAQLTGHVIPEGPYDTVAGYVMARLGRLPFVGATVDAGLIPVDPGEDGRIEVPWRFTVEEMDGRRAAWLSVRQVNGEAQ